MTKDELDELRELACDAGEIYGCDWDSALVRESNQDIQYHGLISEKTNDVVVSANDDSRETSWLCDYLEKCSPSRIIKLVDYVKGMQKSHEEAESTAIILEMIGSLDSDDITGDIVDLRFELNGFDTGSDVSITQFATEGANVIRALVAKNDL